MSTFFYTQIVSLDVISGQYESYQPYSKHKAVEAQSSLIRLLLHGARSTRTRRACGVFEKSQCFE